MADPDVSIGHARELISIERTIADAVNDLSDDEDDFERLAEIIESGGISDPANEMSERERGLLAEAVIPDSKDCRWASGSGIRARVRPNFAGRELSQPHLTQLVGRTGRTIRRPSTERVSAALEN